MWSVKYVEHLVDGQLVLAYLEAAEDGIIGGEGWDERGVVVKEPGEFSQLVSVHKVRGFHGCHPLLASNLEEACSGSSGHRLCATEFPFSGQTIGLIGFGINTRGVTCRYI